MDNATIFCQVRCSINFVIKFFFSYDFPITQISYSTGAQGFEENGNQVFMFYFNRYYSFVTKNRSSQEEEKASSYMKNWGSKFLLLFICLLN